MGISIISITIAFVSLMVSIYFSIKANKKDDKKEIKQETSEFTTVLIELKYISKGITNIETDITTIRKEQQELRDRVVAGERDIKQAHKRLDEHETRLEGLV